MIVVRGRPPIWDRAVSELGATADTVFAWGDRIYSPSSAAIPPDVLAHEEVHGRRQLGDPAAWWERYLADPAFRLDEEVAAYRRQFQMYCSSVARWRGQRVAFLERCAGILAGPLYGGLVDLPTARRLIRS